MVLTSCNTQCISITKTILLIILCELITLCSKHQINPTSKLRTNFRNSTTIHTYSYHYLQSVEIGLTII